MSFETIAPSLLALNPLARQTQVPIYVWPAVAGRNVSLH